MKRLLFALLVVGLAASACSDDPGNVFSLTEGTCFDDQDSADQIDNVPIVDCATAHDNEVFHLFDLADGDFPGEDVVFEAAGQGCVDAFDAYVGFDYASSQLDVLFLTPTEDGWEDGNDREVVCFLYRIDLEQMTGSMQGAGI